LAEGIIFDRPPEKAFDGKHTVILLLLGCDEDRFYRGTLLHGSNISRQYARTDMMLLTKLDFDNKKISALSIPRDTMVSVPGYKRHKINAYFSFAPFIKSSSTPVLLQRAALTQTAVEELLPGVKVDQSVVLNFDAFKSLVDLVGGIDLDVENKMDYDDDAGELHIHLKPGEQHLTGYEAMGYVRFRHDSESDFGRQARQKQFMLAFKQGVVSNLTKLPEVVNSGKKVLNGSLNDDQIIALFSFSRKVPPANIQMGMVPVLEKRNREIVLDTGKIEGTLRQFGFLGK
jgi:LCP family protein required for cell wall assembly